LLLLFSIVVVDMTQTRRHGEMVVYSRRYSFHSKRRLYDLRVASVRRQDKRQS
jgi:hypothetical protein